LRKLSKGAGGEGLEDQGLEMRNPMGCGTQKIGVWGLYLPFPRESAHLP